MKLNKIIESAGRRLAVPLMGYPGAELTSTSLKQNGFNWGVHFWSISELADRLDPDAMFFMMDLSVEAGALGFPIRYPLQESPTVESHLVKAEADLEQFMAVDILKDARVNVFLQTMTMMSENISPLKGGYCIGPFTLAGLLMGASEVAMATIDNPSLVHRVLQFGTNVITRYAVSLVDHGADMIAILEPTAVMLSPKQFEEFSGAYVKQISRAVHAISILHICGDTTHLVGRMCETGVEGLSLDSRVDFLAVEPRLKNDVALIGNIDPVRVMRDMKPDGVAHEMRLFLEKTRGIRNLIVSTGCDLPQDTPIENIRVMIEETKTFSL